jgi:hypothetical protein
MMKLWEKLAFSMLQSRWEVSSAFFHTGLGLPEGSCNVDPKVFSQMINTIQNSLKTQIPIYSINKIFSLVELTTMISGPKQEVLFLMTAKKVAV